MFNSVKSFQKFDKITLGKVIFSKLLLIWSINMII